MKKILRTVSEIGSNTVELVFSEHETAEVITSGNGYEILADKYLLNQDIEEIVAIEIDIDKLNLPDVRNKVPSEYVAAIEAFVAQK